MNKNTFAVTALSATLALTGLAMSSAAQADTMVKCYGVAKAGKNGCAAPGHACAGQSTRDNSPSDWVQMAKASCEQMGGKLSAPKS